MSELGMAFALIVQQGREWDQEDKIVQRECHENLQKRLSLKERGSGRLWQKNYPSLDTKKMNNHSLRPPKHGS